MFLYLATATLSHIGKNWANRMCIQNDLFPQFMLIAIVNFRTVFSFFPLFCHFCASLLSEDWNQNWFTSIVIVLWCSLKWFTSIQKLHWIFSISRCTVFAFNPCPVEIFCHELRKKLTSPYREFLFLCHFLIDLCAMHNIKQSLVQIHQNVWVATGQPFEEN